MAQSKEEKAAYMRQWHLNRRPIQLAKMRANHRLLKDLCYSAYGGYVCKCCGERNEKFLSIDHINNDGASHRKLIGNRGGIGLYYWLRDNNYPPGFQVLCCNCNMGKARNKGVCPHKEINMKKMLANPLGHLEMELIHDQSTISMGSMMGDDVIRDQAPVHESLGGSMTFKADASMPTKRSAVEMRRGYFDSGVDLKGASMEMEFGRKSGDMQSKDFSDDKSA